MLANSEVRTSTTSISFSYSAGPVPSPSCTKGHFGLDLFRHPRESRLVTDDETFRLVVTSAMTADGIWVIHFNVEVPDSSAGEIDLGKLRLAVVEALKREGLRGRSLGATGVLVHLDPKILSIDPTLASLRQTIH